VLRQVLLARTYLRQRHPDCERATALAASAISSLEGSVDSARCVSHLAGLLHELAPHQRRGAPLGDLVTRATRLMSASKSR
jgi:hypothetical protein